MACVFVELLISLVQNSRVLWDMKHKDYHNRLLVDREWKRIAADLRETKESVKNKWKNIRDKFKKECKKIPKARSGDSGHEASLYTGSWPYFDSLVFLRSIITPKETEGNITASSDMTELPSNGEEEVESEVPQGTSESQEVLEPSQNTQPPSQLILQSPVHSPSSLSSALTQSSQVPQKKRKTVSARLQQEQEKFDNTLPSKDNEKTPITVKHSRKRSMQHRDELETELLDLEKKKNSLLEQQNIMDEDEDLNFFKSLLPHVRKLPSVNKLYFRNQVQSNLINELSKIENNESFSDSRNVASAASPVSNTFSLLSPVLPGTSSQEFNQYQVFTTNYNSPNATQNQSGFIVS